MHAFCLMANHVHLLIRFIGRKEMDALTLTSLAGELEGCLLQARQQEEFACVWQTTIHCKRRQRKLSEDCICQLVKPGTASACHGTATAIRKFHSTVSTELPKNFFIDMYC